MNQAIEKLNQLSVLAKDAPWSDAMEKTWKETLITFLSEQKSSFLEQLPALLMDKSRNQFYSQILVNSVVNKRVLLLNTKVGDLAILAIKNGASHVVAVEPNPQLAALARQTFQRNGVNNKVTLLEKLSVELDPHDVKDCEVVLHELLQAEPFALSHCELLAHIHTLMPRARFLPERVRLNFSILERQKLPTRFQALPTNDQIDLSPLERARRGHLLPLHLESALANQGQQVFDLKFKDCRPLQSREESMIGPDSNQAAVIWFEIFDGDHKLKSWGPDSAEHWGQLVWLPPTGARQIRFTQTPTCLKLEAL